MRDISNNIVFVFLTANGKPTSYTFTYSSNQNVHLSAPDKEVIEKFLKETGTFLNTLGNPEFDAIASARIKAKGIKAIKIDGNALKELEKFSFYNLQQKEEIEELKERITACEALKEEVALLKQQMAALIAEK